LRWKVQPPSKWTQSPIYGRFTGGFDTRDLKEAKALLEQLEA
jgi:hypothetical protein